MGRASFDVNDHHALADDPAYLKTDLETEYQLGADVYAWDDGVLRSLARTSIEASVADEDTKRGLLAELDSFRI